MISFIVSSATIYWPCSFLRFCAVSFVDSPRFLASFLMISPILITIAPFCTAISETKPFPEPGNPDIPIIFIVCPLLF